VSQYTPSTSPSPSSSIHTDEEGQFIKRKSKFVDVEAIRSTVVGMKDTGTSSTVVIDRLFKKPPRKKGASTSDDRYLNRIVRDVQTCGEYEKISQGTSLGSFTSE
jgi:chromosome transmission fidelity protein 18